MGVARENQQTLSTGSPHANRLSDESLSRSLTEYGTKSCL
jgi:hypothetical protein